MIRVRPEKWKLPRNVIALGLVSLFNDASSEIIYPLLPLFLIGALGAGPAFVGLIEGVTESASSLLNLPAGWLSDRIRRRKGLVLFGYGLASLARPGLAMAGAAWHVMGLRLVDRIGKGARSGPRDALIADSSPPEARGIAFGFHRAMDHLGAIVGALLSAWLLGLFNGDFRRVFWAASIPALIAVSILIFAVRETPIEPAAEAARKAVDPNPPIRFTGNFKGYLAALLLFTLGNSSDAFLLLRAWQAGIGVTSIPLLWAALHLSKSVFSLLGGGMSDRLGRKRLIVSGWIVYAVIYLAFAAASTPPHIWALFLCYGIYFGLTEGVEKAFVADLTAPQMRGSAFGLYNLIIGIGALPASLLTGWLWQRFGAETALGAGAIVSLLAAAMLLFVREERKR
ncbi:MAG: MFS transporter [Blastocatellia bacterium]